jgi:hypothetical protein
MDGLCGDAEAVLIGRFDKSKRRPQLHGLSAYLFIEVSKTDHFAPEHKEHV